ncbi:Cytochrome-c peroxidase [Shewanella sediminis HAW-EB3]|uniref:Cytochrome-c peroxidase n=1 Tax=Shewanella sediminis (strain HAW-EB3) TaxID=425104 RepID=A8FS95_SHESH|nr:cytochrome c peroxidase [Shewanella sediminis]ABV35718.1 Cytochrome-c peroxidase [Shewanella sediminis HAW-EB3]
MRAIINIISLATLALTPGVLLALEAQEVELQGTPFTLAESCPPSFELIKEEEEKDRCRLVNQYQFYDSVQGRGLGGTQTSLPRHRDGFTPEQIDLGRYLFFDPLLSKDGSISCASCHQPEKGFSDDLDRSIGITGEKVGRGAPTLWNVAFLDKFFWDVRAKTLEEQAQGPLFDPGEMGNTPENLLQTLRENGSYPSMFAQAFPEASRLELSQVYTAITAFQTTLISLNSRYDRYAHGYHEALTENEILGLNVFRSFVARCAECHQPPLFTNNQIAVIGTPEPQGRALDIGAEKTYDAPKLRGAFKVPTLRNITKSAPYMHSGRYSKLRDAVKFYNDGRGNSIPDGESMLLHWHISEPDLTDDELDRIVDFLGALTDESLTPKVPQAVPSGLAVIDEKYQQEKIKQNPSSKTKNQSGE